MIIEFGLPVLYTQVVVHRKGLPRPGLLWTDDHVAQGFAWADEIAAFGVPDHDGDCFLQVDEMPDEVSVDPKSLWAIKVPFRVTFPILQAGTIGILRDFPLAVGDYGLVFQAFPSEKIEGVTYAFRLNMTFFPFANVDFAILKKGAVLTTDKVLRRDAEHG